MRSKYRMDGGIPITAGGYGCIFDPPLKCKDKKEHYDPTKISKLMKRKNAIDEYTEITKFKNILKNIPNADKYFIFDITYCKPAPLTKEDLKDFDKKCSNFRFNERFKAKNMQKENVLDELLVLNMTNGGIDIDTYLSKKPIDIEKLYNLFFGLKELINKAVIPMNKLGVYHFDLKSSNIVINFKNQMRIIDWGLSGIVKNIAKPVKLLRKPLQYNNPIYTILANNDSFQMYNEFLQKSHNPKRMLEAYVRDYYSYWQNRRGLGHIEYLRRVYSNIFKKEISRLVFNNIIVKMLQEYLAKYTDFEKKTFNDSEFMKVLYHNIDIYGVLTSITLLLNNKVLENIILDSKKKKIFEEMIYSICQKYIVSSYNAINITELNDSFNNVLQLLKPQIDLSPNINIPAPPASYEKLNPKKTKRKRKYIILNNNNNKNSVKKNTRIVVKKKKPRCPNGSRRNPKTGLCEPNIITINNSKNNKAKNKNITHKKRKPRCPNGSRRNPKTGNCEKYNK